MRSRNTKPWFPNSVHTVGYFPPRYWLGFVIFNQKIDNTALGEARKLANTVHSDIARAVPGVKGSKPGVSIDDDLLTIGFAPPLDVNIFEA